MTRARRSTPRSSSSATRFYAEAGVAGVEVLVNSIGDPACRPAYLAELAGYYRGHAASLPPTELDRLERNALRLLDSKDPAMAELNAAAPRITDRLCEACAAHFESVKAHLSALGVPFRVEPGLVRGLDYYTRTAFEYYVAGREGQQQALGGGGRYDGLVELLGGKPTPGIGFGLGLDRVALVLAEQGGGGRRGARGTARGGRRRGPRGHGHPAPGRHRPAGRRAAGAGRSRPPEARPPAGGRRQGRARTSR